MAKFCSQCGAMMEDAQMFCGSCGAQAAAPVPVQEAAPQYGAPQYGAPQYGTAPQYGPESQYGAPQYGAAPQYAAPQYGAPQYAPAPAGNSFFSQLDWMGMLKGKAPLFQNCLAALAVQVLSFIMFFLPMISVKAKAWGYSAKVTSGIFKASSGAGYLIPILSILALLGSVAFLLLPLFQKKEIKLLNVLVFFAGQTVYFLTMTIGVIIKVIIANSNLKSYLSSSSSCGIAFGFILFVIFTLAAMFVSGRILFFNKDEVMAIIKKQPVNAYANNNYVNNNVVNNYPNEGYVNNNVNNNYPNNYGN